MSKTRAAQAFALLAIVALPVSALADARSEAKDKIKRATELHGEGKFAEALEQMTLAYTLDPQPDLLYAIGQLHVKLGQCDEATLFYKRFLGTKPKKGPASAAKEAIASCKKVAKQEKVDKPDKAPPVEPEPPPADPEPPPAPSPDPGPFAGPSGRADVSTKVERRPWYTDVLGDLFVASGAVAGVAAVFMYRGALSDLDEAESATTWDRADELDASARSKRLWAVGLGAGAVVLTGAGVARYIWGDRTKKEKRELVIAPNAAGGGVVGVRGSF